MAALLPWSSSCAAARRKLVPTGVSSRRKSERRRQLDNWDTGTERPDWLVICIPFMIGLLFIRVVNMNPLNTGGYLLMNQLHMSELFVAFLLSVIIYDAMRQDAKQITQESHRNDVKSICASCRFLLRATQL